MTPKEERDMHAQAWDAWDAARAPVVPPKDAAKADFIRAGGPDNLMAAYGADRGPVFDPESEPPAGATAPALSPRALSMIRGRRGGMPTPARVTRPATPAPEAFNGNVRPGSDTPPIPDAPPSADVGSGGDAPPAPAQAPAPQGDLGYFSVLSRLNDQFAPHQLGKKPDYTNTNAIDAMDKEQRSTPDKMLRAALLKARLAKATAPAGPHTNDALETAKFNKQWELDHPKETPGKTQAQFDAESDALVSERKAQAARAGHAGSGARAGSATPAGMTDDQIQYWAANGVLHGMKPNLPRNDPDWRRIAAASADWAKLNDTDPAAAQAKSKALGGALKNVESGAAKVNAYEGAAEGAMKLVSDVSKRVHRIGYAPLDAMLNQGGAALGNSDRQLLMNNTRTLASEYARVMGGINGVTSDQARQHAEQMLAHGLSDGTMDAVMDQFRQEFKARNEGNEKELARISDAIKGMRGGTQTVKPQGDAKATVTITATRPGGPPAHTVPADSDQAKYARAHPDLFAVE